jgi:hypothetical protein
VFSSVMETIAQVCEILFAIFLEFRYELQEQNLRLAYDMQRGIISN